MVGQGSEIVRVPLHRRKRRKKVRRHSELEELEAAQRDGTAQVLTLTDLEKVEDLEREDLLEEKRQKTDAEKMFEKRRKQLVSAPGCVCFLISFSLHMTVSRGVCECACIGICVCVCAPLCDVFPSMWAGLFFCAGERRGQEAGQGVIP